MLTYDNKMVLRRDSRYDMECSQTSQKGGIAKMFPAMHPTKPCMNLITNQIMNLQQQCENKILSLGRINWF